MRFGFVAGVWALATIYHDWRTYTAEPISQADTTLLRSELASTRQLLEDLREHQSHCDWRVWVLSWSFWLILGADCLVILWVTRSWWAVPRRIDTPPLALTGDIGGTSSESDTSPLSGVPQVSTAISSGGSTPKAKSRPTRPSDLRSKWNDGSHAGCSRSSGSCELRRGSRRIQLASQTAPLSGGRCPLAHIDARFGDSAGRPWSSPPSCVGAPGPIPGRHLCRDLRPWPHQQSSFEWIQAASWNHGHHPGTGQFAWVRCFCVGCGGHQSSRLWSRDRGSLAGGREHWVSFHIQGRDPEGWRGGLCGASWSLASRGMAKIPEAGSGWPSATWGPSRWSRKEEAGSFISSPSHEGQWWPRVPNHGNKSSPGTSWGSVGRQWQLHHLSLGVDSAFRGIASFGGGSHLRGTPPHAHVWSGGCISTGGGRTSMPLVGANRGCSRDFTGLDILAGTATLQDGRAHTAKFNEWISGRLKERASIWKQERLYQQERKNQRAGRWGGGTGGDDDSDSEDGKGKGKKKKLKKKKNKKPEGEEPPSGSAHKWLAFELLAAGQWLVGFNTMQQQCMRNFHWVWLHYIVSMVTHSHCLDFANRLSRI